MVHEAYLRLVDQSTTTWQNRAHFFGVAAQVMRRILVDYARSHRAEKRGGGWDKLAFDEALAPALERSIDLVALDEALKDLLAVDPRQSQIVELRYFGGLTNEEIGEVLDISPRTVKREWRLAKAWLRREIMTGENDASGGLNAGLASRNYSRPRPTSIRPSGWCSSRRECDGDEALRREIETLLDSDDKNRRLHRGASLRHSA